MAVRLCDRCETNVTVWNLSGSRSEGTTEFPTLCDPCLKQMLFELVIEPGGVSFSTSPEPEVYRKKGVFGSRLEELE